MSIEAEIVPHVLGTRRRVPPGRTALVAITGIDGSGKGHVASRLERALTARGLRVGVLGIDGFLNLPSVRFGGADPGAHFYEHAFCFDELFDTLVTPLAERRSIRVEANFTEETATAYRRHVYEYHDLDVLLLEGIFLLKKELRAAYDLSVYLDCTFGTALERAVARAQEGLSPAETITAYRTIYFPAQEVHFARDAPRRAADVVVANDPVLVSVDRR